MTSKTIRHTFTALAAVGLVSLFAIRTVFGQAFDVADIVKRAKPWVVTIICYDASGQAYGQGSGFFIASGDLVTSHHVLAGAARAVIHDANNNQMEISAIVGDDPEADIVKAETMMTRRGTGFGIPLGTSLPEEGEEVVVIGSPKGLDFTTSEGIVSALRKESNMPAAIQLTAATSPGSSGSPVMNMHGEVIGIVETKYGDAENVTFATPVSCLNVMKDEPPTPLAVWAKGYSTENTSSEDRNEKENDHARASVAASDIGNEYYEKKDFQKALDRYMEAIMEDPSNIKGWFGAGRCFELSRDFEHATESFQNAVELDPTAIDPLYHLGQALYLNGHYAEAAEEARKCIAIAPDNGFAWNGLGRSYEKLNRNTEALAALDSARKYAPDFYAVHTAIAEVYLKQGRFVEAEAELDTDLKTGRTPYILIPLAEVYFQTHRVDSGHKLLIESLRATIHDGRSEADPELLDRLGDDFVKSGAYREGLMTLQYGLAIDPRNARMHYNLGICYWETGEQEVAIGEYKQAIREDSLFAPAYFDLGISEFQVHHDREAALADYTVLQKLDPKLGAELLDKMGK